MPSSECNTLGGFWGPGNHAPLCPPPPRLSGDMCRGVGEEGWVKALLDIHGPMSERLCSGLGVGVPR